MIKSATALGVIPARAHSSRFPFKILAKINGKSMLQHVWENALEAKTLSRVIIATDHPDIARAAQAFGATAVLTPEFESGSDRVAFIAKDSTEDFVVNIQGDEPLLEGREIDALVKALHDNPTADLATLAVRKSDSSELENPNVVKVSINHVSEALYFSRAPIKVKPSGEFLKHIGIYAYRRNALLTFCQTPQSLLELTERLEQMRALENGMKIQIVVVEKDTIAVDTPEDIDRVERALASRGHRS